MKKHLLFTVLLILALSLSACNPNVPKENDVPDASSSPETTEETVKPADVSTEEKNDPGSEVEFLWNGMEKEYTGDFSYLDTDFFKESDVITLRSACKYKDGESPVIAGGWVYCDELEEDLTYYDLKEMTEVFPGRSMHIVENNYITKEMTEYDDSLFCELLNDAVEYTPIPAVYDFLSPPPLECLVYMPYENDDSKFSLSVYEMGEGEYLLSIVYRERDFSYVRPADGDGPTVKHDYYRSAAIVK